MMADAKKQDGPKKKDQNRATPCTTLGVKGKTTTKAEVRENSPSSDLEGDSSAEVSDPDAQ